MAGTSDPGKRRHPEDQCHWHRDHQETQQTKHERDDTERVRGTPSGVADRWSGRRELRLIEELWAVF
jgi:hypothetical protein